MTISDPVLISIIGGVFGTLHTVIYLAVLRKIGMTQESMSALEKNTNSKMDALLDVTGKAEFAKGVKQEKERQENR